MCTVPACSDCVAPVTSLSDINDRARVSNRVGVVIFVSVPSLSSTVTIVQTEILRPSCQTVVSYARDLGSRLVVCVAVVAVVAATVEVRKAILHSASLALFLVASESSCSKSDLGCARPDVGWVSELCITPIHSNLPLYATH